MKILNVHDNMFFIYSREAHNMHDMSQPITRKYEASDTVHVLMQILSEEYRHT